MPLRERTDSLNQHWRLVSHAERGHDFYLVSVVHPRCALALADHLQGNDGLNTPAIPGKCLDHATFCNTL